jgi:hypothetical protein
MGDSSLDNNRPLIVHDMTLVKQQGFITTTVDISRTYDIPSNVKSCIVSARQRLFGQLQANNTEISELQLLPFFSEPLQLSRSTAVLERSQSQKQELRKRAAGHPIVSKNKCTEAEDTKIKAALTRVRSLALYAATQLEVWNDRQRHSLFGPDY